MVKKKIVKKVKPVKVAKAKTKAPALKASNFEDQVKSVLSHLLDLFKASLIDAFRQYVESRIKSGTHASMDDFNRHFQHTIAAHGIQEETLLASLDDVELEYLNRISSTPVESFEIGKPLPVAKATHVEAPKAKEETPTKGVFDSLDLI